MDIANRVRAYSYLSSVLADREADPYCRSCSSFLDTLANVTGDMSEFERRHAAEIQELPDQMSLFFYIARSRLKGIRRHIHPVAQRKTGRCTLPPGACFLKHSHSILQKMQNSENLFCLVRPFPGRKSAGTAE